MPEKEETAIWVKYNMHGAVVNCHAGGELEQWCKEHNLPLILENDGYEKVNRYNLGKIEPIDVIEDWNLNFNLGSVIKYICRRSTKDSELDNLRKAEAYLRREINRLDGTPGWGKQKTNS